MNMPARNRLLIWKTVVKSSSNNKTTKRNHLAIIWRFGHHHQSSALKDLRSMQEKLDAWNQQKKWRLCPTATSSTTLTEYPVPARKQQR
jgi:hypothetical protein